MCEKVKGQVTILELMEQLEHDGELNVIETAKQIVRHGNGYSKSKENIVDLYRLPLTPMERIALVKAEFGQGGVSGYHNRTYVGYCTRTNGIEIAYKTGTDKGRVELVTWQLIDLIISDMIRTGTYL